MSDFDETISTHPTVPQRAPAPPSKFQLVESSDWAHAKAVLLDAIDLNEWLDWWSQTPWHLSHSKKTIQWTQSKKTAEIWQYYQPCARNTDGQPFIRCTRCTSVLTHPAIGNTGTTALIRHLETKACKKAAKRDGLRTIESFLTPSDNGKVYIYCRCKDHC